MKKRLLTAACCLLFHIAAWSHSIFLTDMTGKKISFDSLQGKWVLINYWASWCQPCLHEIPILNNFYEKNKEKVALFAINYDAVPLETQQNLMTQYHMNYPGLSKDPADVLQLGDIVGVPATFVFNPKGEYVKVSYGAQTLNSLHRLIEK